MSATGQTPTIGVIAMQGAFAEHVALLDGCGVTTIEVRTLDQLAACDGIVIPGGESTAIRKALDRCGMLEVLTRRIAGGLPAFGTCAGLIVLAHAPVDGAPPSMGLLNVTVARNGFGRQACSFEGEVEVVVGERSTTIAGVFIRAPRIEALGDDVDVIGRIAAGDYAGEPVAVQQGCLLGATFHPELTSSSLLHERFIEMVRVAAPVRG